MVSLPSSLTGLSAGSLIPSTAIIGLPLLRRMETPMVCLPPFLWVLKHRAYPFVNDRYITIIPAMLVIGTCSKSVSCTYYQAQIHPVLIVSAFGSLALIAQADTTDEWFTLAAPWVIATAATSFVANLFGTGVSPSLSFKHEMRRLTLDAGLLAYKIWSNLRAVAQSNAAAYNVSRTQSALIIIIESAAVYLASLIVYFVLTVINSIAQFVVLSIVSRCMSTSFLLRTSAEYHSYVFPASRYHRRHFHRSHHPYFTQVT